MGDETICLSISIGDVKMKKSYLLLILVLCLGTAVQAAPSVIHYWDFNSDADDNTERMADKVGSVDLDYHFAGTTNSYYQADLSNNTMKVTASRYGLKAHDMVIGQDLNFGTDSFAFSFDAKFFSNSDTRQMRILDARANDTGFIWLTDYNKHYLTIQGNADGGASQWIPLFEEDTEDFFHVVINVDRSGTGNAVTKVYVNGVETLLEMRSETLADDVEVYFGKAMQLGYKDNGNSAGATQPGEMDNVAFYTGDILSIAQINSLADGSLTPMDFTGATNPAPAKGQTGVPIDVALTWTPATNPSSQKQYLYGNFSDPTDPNLAYIGELAQGADSYDIPFDLAHETDYQWRIVEAIDNGAGGYYAPGDPNNVFGPVWNFTTTSPLPTIDTQPVGVTVPAGETAVFTIEGGASVANYEWYKVAPAGDVLISAGVAETELLISPVSLEDEGQYYCVLSNASGDILMSDVVGLWTERLMGHWTFDDTLIDEVDGFVGVYTDPNEANPIAPTPVYDAGIVGNAVQFNGDQVHVRVADSNDIFDFHPQGFTAGAWIKYTGEASASYGIMGKYQVSPVQGWSSRIYYQDVMWYYGDGETSSYKVTSGDLVPPEQWYHLVISYDPDANLSYYLNGRRIYNTAASGLVCIPAPSGTPLVFGATTVLGSNSFIGLMDEVKLWSYPLTAEDIFQEYVNGTGVSDCYENPAYDFTGPEGEPDCVVDFYDFVEFASSWLNIGIVNPK